MPGELKNETAAALAELRSRSAPIIERAPLPVVEAQGSAHIVSYANSAFCRLLGKPRSELIGKPFAEIVCGGADCLPILNKVYQTGEAVTHVRDDDAEPDAAFWLFAMWPALDERDCPVGVIIQLTRASKLRSTTAEANEALLIAGLRQHELTETAEKLNAELQAAKEQIGRHAANLETVVAERTAKLRDSIKSLESLTYTMAHDLRAPIRAMRSFTSAMLEDIPLNEEGKGFAERINAAAERMDQLVNDLLEYSQLTHLDFPIHTVDLKAPIERAIDEVSDDIMTAGAEIEVREPLPRVAGNETLLDQVLSNLLGNAFKFVTPGVNPKIVFRAETRGATVRLWIEDNGIGIASQYHDKIFGVFQRLHTVEQFPGTGVGLAIARKAVERMGGSVGVESEAGKGSRFWIELPKAADE